MGVFAVSWRFPSKDHDALAPGRPRRASRSVAGAGVAAPLCAFFGISFRKNANTRGRSLLISSMRQPGLRLAHTPTLLAKGIPAPRPRVLCFSEAASCLRSDALLEPTLEGLPKTQEENHTR